MTMENIRVLIERRLRREGYDVAAFADGARCLSALDEDAPEAMCLDMNMPGLRGRTPSNASASDAPRCRSW